MIMSWFISWSLRRRARLSAAFLTTATPATTACRTRQHCLQGCNKLSDDPRWCNMHTMCCLSVERTGKADMG